MTFGLLSKLEFLQDWASMVIATINPALMHNLRKYHALKKVHYLAAIEGIEGDYLEFGVFRGSSFCHSIRCHRAMERWNPRPSAVTFWGFDSFAGFGVLQTDDQHPFYVDTTFDASLVNVERRVRRAAGQVPFRLIPGFFDQTLRDGPGAYGIRQSRIIFIDSDTYSSASAALGFCASTIQEGTFIVLDDYFSYRGGDRRGVARAFAEFVERGRLTVRHVFTYGMGGVVYVVAAKP
jgi:O-methyltransferase